MSDYADVDIRWLPAAEGGRATSIHLRAAGTLSYKPHLRVGAEGDRLGVAFLDGEPPVAAPGDQGSALVALIYVETGVDYASLVPGAVFEVLEGTGVIGNGTVRRRWHADDDWRSRPAG